MSKAASAEAPQPLPHGAYSRPDGEIMLPIGPHQAVGEAAFHRLGFTGRVRG